MTSPIEPNNDRPAVQASPGAPIFSVASLLGLFLGIIVIFNFLGSAISVLVAVIAIVCGLVGMLEAVLPSRRGGVISLFAVLVGLAAIVLAILRLTGVVVHGAPTTMPSALIGW